MLTINHILMKINNKLLLYSVKLFVIIFKKMKAKNFNK